MEDIKDKATELTEEELKDVDGAGCGCEDVPVLKEELTEEELKGVDGGVYTAWADIEKGINRFFRGDWELMKDPKNTKA